MVTSRDNGKNHRTTHLKHTLASLVNKFSTGSFLSVFLISYYLVTAIVWLSVTLLGLLWAWGQPL